MAIIAIPVVILFAMVGGFLWWRHNNTGNFNPKSSPYADVTMNPAYE